MAIVILMIRTALAATAIVFLATGDALPPSPPDPTQPLPPPAARAADADGPRDPDGRPQPPAEDDRPGSSPDGRPALSALHGSGVLSTPDRSRDVDEVAGQRSRGDAARDERGEGRDRDPVAGQPTTPDTTPEDLADQADTGDPTDDPRLVAQSSRSDDEVVLSELDVSPGQGPSGDLRLAPSTGGTAQIQLGSTDIKAGPGCFVQCITGGVAYARGVGVKLVVTTDTPADIWLNVYRPGFADPRLSPNPVTTFSTLHLDLEPGTDYEVLVAATDSEGHTSYATGSFTTLRRSAVVTFGDVELVSSASSASVLAYTRVDGSWTAHGAPIPHDGATVGLNFPPVALTDTGRKLDVLVQLAQSGAGGGGKVCEAPELPIDSGGGGTISCYYYNSTSGLAIDLDHRPPGTTSWTGHTLELLLGSSPTPIEFWVPVTIQVTYS